VATDVADWTSSVVIQSGSVSIVGTATVTISGTANVAITGTPTVILGAGTASVGSVSAINSTVTVAGTINIGNTPAVTISGTPTVNIGNSPTVSISGTVTVSVSNTPSVTINGTPTVNIGLGVSNVTATGNLNVLNAAVTLNLAGLSGAGFQLAAGTFQGTIVFELSFDGGTTWQATQFTNPTDGSVGQSLIFGANNGAITRSLFIAGGADHVRARVSAFTSGTAAMTITGTASQTIQVLISGNPSVNIGNTPAVTVSGTVTVSVSNTPAVTISGTPSVTISSGTVSISGTPNINISAQSITVQVNLPWRTVTQFSTVGAGAENFTTGAVGAGAQTMRISIEGSTKFITNLTITGVTTGIVYEQENNVLALSGTFTVPINGSRDSTYKLAWVTSSGAATKIDVDASDLNMGYPSLGQDVAGNSLPVVIASDQARIPVLPSVYDAQGTNAPAAGTAASVVLGATSGKQYRAALLDASAMTSAATASIDAFQVLDGVTVIFNRYCGQIAGTGSTSPPLALSDAALFGTTGNSMTAKFTAGATTTEQAVNIGTYQQ
jgi:hypothetical protein